MGDEFVTRRRPRRTKSFLDLSYSCLSNNIEQEQNMLETSAQSEPNTTMEDYQITEIKSEIEQLHTKCASAELEIENLCLENSDLKRSLEKCQKLLCVYKKLGAECSSPLSTRKRRRCSMIRANNSNEHEDFSMIKDENDEILDRLIADKMKLQNTNLIDERERNRKLEDELSQVKKENEKLQSEKQNKLEEIEEQLRTKAKHCEDLAMYMDERHETLNSQIAEKEKIILLLTEEQKQYIEQISQLNRDNQLQKTKLMNEKEKNLRLEEELALLKKENLVLQEEKELFLTMNNLVEIEEQLKVKSKECEEWQTKYDKEITGNAKKQIVSYKKILKGTRTNKTKKLYRKIKQQKKVMNKIGNEIRQIKSENNKLIRQIENLERHTISSDMSENQTIVRNIIEKIPNQNIPQLVNDTMKSSKRKEVLIFSDVMGRDMASKLYERNVDKKITNYCYPGKPINLIYHEILEKSKKLKQNDTLMLLLSTYNGRHDKLEYSNLLKDLLNATPERPYNVVVCSIKQTGQGNDTINKINKKLYTMASTNKNIKYVEINNGTRKLPQILANCLHNFQATTNLKYVTISDQVHPRENFQQSHLPHLKT